MKNASLLPGIRRHAACIIEVLAVRRAMTTRGLFQQVMLLTAMAFLILASGCGLSQHTVEGDVEVDGVPLAKGSITFWPTAESAKGNPTGNIENGKFKMSAGVPKGSYKVTVNAFDKEPDSTKPFAAKRLVHQKYTEAAKTPLTVEVPSGSYKFTVSAKK
jgi:hypothetical protein